MTKQVTITPLMKQYQEMKAKHPDAILLFRFGDFYEAFSDDAIAVSEICGCTLARRANGKASSIELAGFPNHALDTYLHKLVRAGKRVAICEQLEDPKPKKDVTEDVKPVTPKEEPKPEPPREKTVEELATKEQDALLNHLEEHGFSVYRCVQNGEIIAECEKYTEGGVDMIMTLNPFSYEELKRYWMDFDIDRLIDIYRQGEQYRSHFTIRQSLEDFEKWKKDLGETIISFHFKN